MVSAIAVEPPIPRESILIHSVVDFTAPNPSDDVAHAFKDAWKALRLLKSPDIATTFGDGYKRYKVPSSQELEAWLNKTFTVAQTGTSVRTVVGEMQLRLEFLPVCYILPQPTKDGTFKGSIVLFISHWRTEAGGSLKIINELLEYASDLLSGGNSTRKSLSNYVLGSEMNHLTPAIEDILMPNQRQSSPEAKIRIEKHFSDYYSKLPSIGFPIIQEGSLSAVPSYELKLNQRSYNPASTSSLVKACRAKGITVTSAVQSAYLGAVWHIAEPGKRNRSYACMMPAEVRKRLPASSPFREQGCWAATQMLMLTVPSGQDFLTRARGLRHQYGLAGQESWLHEDTREVSERTIEHYGKMPTEPVAMPWFTSLGVLDGDAIVREHGGLKVEDVTVWADSIGPGIVLRLWTFRGRLTFHIAWNVAFHGDGQIEEVMDMIDRTLAMELGVEMDIEEVRGVDRQSSAEFGRSNEGLDN